MKEVLFYFIAIQTARAPKPRVCESKLGMTPKGLSSFVLAALDHLCQMHELFGMLQCERKAERDIGVEAVVSTAAYPLQHAFNFAPFVAM